MDNPKHPADCLRHMLKGMSISDYELAVAMIEIYAQTRVIEAIEECRSLVLGSLAAPLSEKEA